MKREIELSEEESALLVELLEEDQNRLNAEPPPRGEPAKAQTASSAVRGHAKGSGRVVT
jgi:hypothetical protein